MSEAPEQTAGSRVWPLIAAGLVAAGWLVFVATQLYADLLRQQWGPAPDVMDALGRDGYVCARTLPYLSAVMALDAGAAVALVVRSRRGWPLAVKVLAGVLLVPSAGLHGLVWLVCGLFAD